jgi:ribonuclease D
VADKNAPEVIAAVKRGLALPDEDLPRIPRRPKRSPHQPAVVDLLAAIVKMRSLEVQVAPGLLAPQRYLEDLVQQFPHHAAPPPDLPLLQGWRREVIGQDLLAFLSGTTALRRDPDTGRVCAQPVSNPVGPQPS